MRFTIKWKTSMGKPMKVSTNQWKSALGWADILTACSIPFSLKCEKTQ